VARTRKWGECGLDEKLLWLAFLPSWRHWKIMFKSLYRECIRSASKYLFTCLKAIQISLKKSFNLLIFRLLLLLLLFVCQLNRFQARSLVVEDDVNSAADKLEGSRRDARYILIRRKPIPYNSEPIPYNSNFVYPPVNFLANGKASKIVVNGIEYNGESEKKPTLAGNKEDDIVSVKPAAPSRPNSTITWISGRVQYYKFY